MGVRLAAAVITTCLCGLSSDLSAEARHAKAEALRAMATAFAQTAAPNLTRQQRELLSAIITAVDAAASQPEAADLVWQHHIMRASDGSHYVAFSAEPATPLPPGPVLLYLRLATATRAGAERIAERSPIKEWLAGSRTDPRLLPKSGIAIGDMPIMGPTGNMTVRQPTSTGSNELKLMALERERARQEQEERNKKKRSELEGLEAASRDSFPFEDFDLASQSRNPDGARIITRALTAGPGDYDLFLAWADPSASKPAATVRVVRKSITLEPARTVGLITSGVILADSVSVRAVPYSPAEQASHPYSIGPMEIVPARSSRYSRDDNLSLAVQVINARSTDAGMPDVTVNFRIVKVTGERESAVASLKPQSYNAATLPPNFSLRLGHPLFAAVTAPLATLTRGEYRLKIAVNDRIANTVANTETDFTIIGTPPSLLAEAPPLGTPFAREVVFERSLLTSLVDALTPASPSPALARALAIAKSERPADLLVEEPVPAAEAGIRTALTGLALFSIGDASAAPQFLRALQQNSSASAREQSGELRRDLAGAPSGREGGPTSAIQFLLGAARAMQSRDPDAIAAWQAAIAAGGAPAITPQLLGEALLRRNDPQRAAEALATAPPGGASLRVISAAHIANRREGDAIALLEQHLSSEPEDQAARWLLLHARYAQFARSGKPMAGAEAERFGTEARVYIDAKAANAALAQEWLKSIS